MFNIKRDRKESEIKLENKIIKEEKRQVAKKYFTRKM